MHLRTFARLVWASREHRVRTRDEEAGLGVPSRKASDIVLQSLYPVVMSGRTPQKVLRRGVSIF